MANELNIAYTAGETITAEVYSPGWSSVGSVALTEVSSGLYSGDMPAASAGCYLVTFSISGAVVGRGEIEWDGSAEVCGNNVSTKVDELWKLRGLDSAAATTFRQDKIFVGSEGSPDLEVVLTGDGTTEKVATRTP